MAKEYEFIKPVKERTVYQPDGLGTLRQRPIPEEGMAVPLRGDPGRYYRTALRCGDAEIAQPPKTAKPQTTAKEG